MNLTGYNSRVQSWIQKVRDSVADAPQQTLQYCKKIIEVGEKNNDVRLLGFAYYNMAQTYYSLNDGEHFLDAASRALSYMDEAKEWESVARCYNILGIAALNRGNAPIALDYYMNGLTYCEKYDIFEVEVALNVNCGALNLYWSRFTDAQKYFGKAIQVLKTVQEIPRYHNYMICIYQNLCACYMKQKRLEMVPQLLREIHQVHWDYAKDIDKMGVYCMEAIYFNRNGEFDKRDACIEWVDSRVSDKIPLLDMFEDYYSYCELLLECDKDKEFWHLMDLLDPMVRSFKIVNMQQRELSLKIKYYRKHNLDEEYLQAAALFYELSQKGEEEGKSMVNSMLNLRKRLEFATRARKQIEIQNQILSEKSETDPLTKLANRFKLNDYSDLIFNKAYFEHKPFAIWIIDIDYFKEFNDNYGHQAGDECIKRIADILQEMTDIHNGFCARYGGDEFIMIYENITPDKAERFALELKHKVMDLKMIHEFSQALPIVTVSQGICCDIPVKENKLWDFLHKADDMLYEIKKQSRNSYSIGTLSGVVLEDE